MEFGRIAFYLLALVILVPIGLLGLEFFVGLQLYQVVPSDGAPITEIRIKRAPASASIPWLLEVTPLPKDKAGAHPVYIPSPTNSLILHYEGLQWSGVLKTLGFSDRIKLAMIEWRSAPSKTPTTAPINGGSDPCWQLVDLMGPLAFGNATATRWKGVSIKSLSRKKCRVVQFKDKQPRLAPKGSTDLE